MKRLHVSLKDDQYQAIRQEAFDSNISISELVRSRLIKVKIKTPVKDDMAEYGRKLDEYSAKQKTFQSLKSQYNPVPKPKK